MNRLFFQMIFFFFSYVISITIVMSQEFQVNENTDSNDQLLPRIACDGNINFVIVWQDQRNGNWDVYGQRYDCRGIKRGNNFRINEGGGYGDQCSPTVAIDQNGNFTIVWRDDSDQSIYGQRYSLNGTKINGNFKINETSVPSYENHPAIAMTSDGNFVVAWRIYNYILCQRFSNVGDKRGNNFYIDQSGGNQYYPDIAIDENGNFMVAWGDNRSNLANDVYCRKFNYDGISAGVSFVVSDTLPAYQSDPRIAINSNNDYVVVWEDGRNEPYWNVADVYGQYVSSSGTLIGANFKVNEITGFSYQAGAAIATNLDKNNFIVAWDDYRHGEDDVDIYSRLFSPEGQPMGPDVRVNKDMGKAIQHSVDVKWVNNKIYYAWADNRVSGQGKDIFARVDLLSTEKIIISPIVQGHSLHQDFFIEIEVKDVQNLFGVAFKFNFPVDKLEALAAEKGDFLGTDLVFFPDINNSAGVVSVGVSKKSGQPAANGTGIVARIKLKEKPSVTSGITIELSLTEVAANDPLGNTITLTPQNTSYVTPNPTSVAETKNQVPEEYALYPNYPNPFNPTTTISYALPEAAYVQVKIFDVNGREVKRLVDQLCNAGVHSVVWDATDESQQKVSSGIYICRFSVGEVVFNRKLILAK